MKQLKLLLPYLGRWDQHRKSRFHQLAERLARKGFVIHVIQAPPMRSEETTFRTRKIPSHDNIKLHTANLCKHLWNSKLGKAWKKGYYGMAVRKQVSELMEKFSIDVLWLYNLPHYSLSKLEYPVIFDYVDDYIYMLNKEARVLNNLFFRKLELYYFKRLLKRAAIIFAASTVLYSNVKSTVGDKPPCIILPNGVDLNFFTPNVAGKLNVRSVGEYTATVGFVGSFEYYVDFDMILRAAHELPQIRFLLVGAGREFSRIARVANKERLNNVEFAGLVPSEAIPAHISEMDICLNILRKSPRTEAGSIKLLEYLAMGKPVITTTLKEVKNIDKGFLFYADTAEELVGQIKQILDRHSEAVKKASQAIPLIQTKYNWESIAEQFAKAIEAHVL